MSRALTIGTLLLRVVLGYYAPEDQPNSFAEGESVNLKMNKMTSTTTLLPMNYYHLPFSFPDGNVVEFDPQNFGQFLSGDRIQSSPYRLNMKVDMYCEQLGIGNLGREQRKGIHPNKMVQVIQKNYHHNWIVDNLPAATKREDDSIIMTSYTGGFPVGFIGRDYTKKAYIYNHVNIEIQYHNVENEPDRARIVRFTVQPFSIKHDFATNAGGNGPFKMADIQNPIQSCNHKNRSKEHTRYEMVYANDRRPQPAHGGVLFTYDVIWTENMDLQWSSRWHIYLTMDNSIPAAIHWFSIWNSFVLVIMLSAMVATILVRNLHRDFKYYKRLVTDEEKAESIIEFSWKLVHADVFRAPTFSPLLLAVCCGTGSQLLCTSFWTILLSAIGFLSPARRGSLLMALLVSYALSGSVAGYVTARFYKTFNGKSWQKATKCTAYGFPGIAFGLLLVVDIVVLWQESTFALPSMTIVMLLFLWLGISTPLVFFGAYVGYRQDVIILVSTRSAPRRIPAQVFNLPITVTIAACLNFSPCMVEFYFILASVWDNQYYNAFGFLLLVLAILILTCALQTILLNFIRINGENYHWWWSSFSTGGSTGVGAYFYSFVFIRKSGIIQPFSFSAFVIYFGFTGLASLGLFLMTGFVGISACLWFNKAMFASITTDKGISPVSASDFIPISASDLHSRNNHNISSMIRKALIAAFTLTALFSPALFYSSRLGGDSDHQNQWHSTQQMERNDIADSRKLPENLVHSGDDDYRPTAVHSILLDNSGINMDHDNGEGVGNGGGFELDRVGDNKFANREKGEMFVSAEKVHKRHTPYLYGLANLYPTYDAYDVLEIAIVASLWAAIILLSVIVKRRSARPGGRVYLYNQSRVHKILSERRRRLNDILKDPILKDDMKRRYGDLTSLLAVVAEWQSHGFQQKKDECVKIGKWFFVPWIRHVNGCLFFITYMTFYCGFDEVLSLMILSMAFVHLLDNMVLYRAATVKGAPWIAESGSLFAAVGIPVIGIS